MAAFKGQVEVMRILHAKGANIFCRNQNGSNALHIATKKGLFQVVRELLKIKFPLDKLKANGISALAIAAIKGNLPIIKLLVQAGADVNQLGKNGVAPLYMAMKAQNLECMQYLLEQNANVYINDPIWNEMSPVFYAIRLNNPSVLSVVLDSHQAKFLSHMKTAKGFTPIQYAQSLGQDEMVRLLSLRQQTELNHADPEGFTPSPSTRSARSSRWPSASSTKAPTSTSPIPWARPRSFRLSSPKTSLPPSS